MKKLLLLCIGLMAIQLGFSRTLSGAAEISVLTSDPGDAVHTVFGHTAIRVKDDSLKLDAVYNYGTFEFGEPVKFLFNFVRGHLNYQLAAGHYQNFEWNYVYQQRALYEQVLDLTPEEKQKVYNFLSWNLEPENRFYLYDFFLDNCATRVRDIVEVEFAEGLSMDNSFAPEGLTYMQLIDPYLESHPWMAYGIYVGLGGPARQKVELRDYMFLPDYHLLGFDHMMINRNGVESPLVKDFHVIYQPDVMTPAVGIVSPMLVHILLAVILLLVTLWDIKKNKPSFLLERILFVIFGIVGLVLILLWFATDHGATKWNPNVIWAWPIALILVFKVKKLPHWLYGLYVLCLVACMIMALVLPSFFHMALVPVWLVLAIRWTWLAIWKNRQSKYPNTADDLTPTS